MNKKVEPIFIQIDNEKIELKGEALETYLLDLQERKNAQALLEVEYKAKQEARENAIKKLAEVAGLTDEEIGAII